MAFNWQTFRTRTLTAIIFAAVMLVGLLWNQWSFLLLFSVIHFGCWWEYLKLSEKIHNTSIHLHVKLGLMLMGYGLMLLFCGPLYEVNGYGLKENLSLPVSIAGFILLLMGIFQKTPVKINAFGMAAIGLVYISLSWGLMMDLYSFSISKEIYHGPVGVGIATAEMVIPPTIVFSIWINDTMAYIVGSIIGKTPLSKISPKKTWEGTIGGIILGILLMALLIIKIFKFSYAAAWYHWVTIPAIAAIAGTFGDLLESKLKRMAGVKDSGSIMPGHGGFLDRFDSLLLATPCVWLYVKLVMQ
ncbi:MAG TPA: phosphatidate cytidylyltransferase [Chitinophagaceae bacterium]|nr:phosphatidate cytidylyltransferase [Chitinophagaceae bacterium]